MLSRACVGRPLPVDASFRYRSRHSYLPLRKRPAGSLRQLQLCSPATPLLLLLAAGWGEEEGCKLPLQISMEIHYATIYFSKDKTDFSNLFWTQHEMSLGELALWFGHLANLGYGVVSREDNPGGLHCCSEYTFLKVEQPGGCPMISYTPPPGGVPPPRAKNKQQQQKKQQQQRA